MEAAPVDSFTLWLRIPAWAKDATLRINREKIDATLVPGTFCPINRSWSAGDMVELNLPMPVRLIESHPYVEETRNQVAIARGPIVYCLESVDLPSGVRVLDVHLSQSTDLAPATDNRLPGITVLKGHALAMAAEPWSGEFVSRTDTESAARY